MKNSNSFAIFCYHQASTALIRPSAYEWDQSSMRNEKGWGLLFVSRCSLLSLPLALTPRIMLPFFLGRVLCHWDLSLFPPSPTFLLCVSFRPRRMAVSQFTLFCSFWWVAMFCSCWLHVGRKRNTQGTVGPSLLCLNKLLIDLKLWNQTVPSASFFIAFYSHFPDRFLCHSPLCPSIGVHHWLPFPVYHL